MDALTRSAIVAAWVSTVALFPANPSVIAQQPPSTAVELRPGVVIDPQRRVAYVMNPKGGVDAVGLGRGELVWHSDQAARPIGATAALLVAQAELPKPGNELQVRLLDVRTGRLNRSVRHALPTGTRTMVVGTAEGTFEVQALLSASDATLAWQFVAVPLQGVRPGALEVDQPAAERQATPESAPQPTTSGVIRIDLPTGRASNLTASDKVSIPTRQADVPAEAQIGSVTGQQFLSVDGRHVIASERVADDSVWDKYQWTVYERGSGLRLGMLRDYRSHAPFVIVGSSIIYETGPFERRTEQGLISEPLRVRTVELKGVVPSSGVGRSAIPPIEVPSPAELRVLSGGLTDSSQHTTARTEGIARPNCLVICGSLPAAFSHSRRYRMANCMVCSAAALLLMTFGVQTQQPSREPQPQTKQALTGCLRATKADAAKPDDKRIVYTLEVSERDAKDRSKATYQLSPAESVPLAKHVGHRVEIEGDLLQAPGPPGSQAKPLPADSATTFRVSGLKMISAKCQ